MKNNTYKWISVEDELPPKDPDYPETSIGVIVYNPTQKHPVYEDWYIFENEYSEYIGWNCEEGVTHWCYLPEPPNMDYEKKYKEQNNKKLDANKVIEWLKRIKFVKLEPKVEVRFVKEILERFKLDFGL